VTILGINIDGDPDGVIDANKGKEFLKSLGYKKEFEDHKVNGCEHKFNRKKNQFCSICGKPAIREIEAWDYSDLVGEVAYEVAEKTNLDFLWTPKGWVLGIKIEGDYKKCINRILLGIENLRKYFPNENDKIEFYET